MIRERIIALLPCILGLPRGLLFLQVKLRTILPCNTYPEYLTRPTEKPRSTATLDCTTLAVGGLCERSLD